MDVSSLALRSWPATVALLLLVVGCSPPVPGPDPGLARYHDQELTFGSCDGYATTDAEAELVAADPRSECARLEVPLDYEDPGGATAQIAMLRVPARGESRGSLLLNSGGPGGVGTSFAATTAAALARSPITEHFDLIGFDPRGVGASTPTVECFDDAQYLAGDARTEFVFSAGEYTVEDTRRLAEGCARRSGGAEILAHAGSRDAVRDMDVLRAALGEEKLNFLGQSYGTRLGTLYAEMFPQNVRALVLDGAVDPALGADRRVSQYAGFQRSFDAMAAACADTPDCVLGTDPARATETFQGLVRPLLDDPVPYGDGQRFTYNDAVGAVIVALYRQETWPAIWRGLTELRDGDPGRFVRLNQLFSGREPDGGGGNFTAANLAIGCIDEERTTRQAAEDLRRRSWDAAPFADPGRGVEGARGSCESWPAAPDPTYPVPERIDGVPPTLTVSITGDPSTPYDAGVRLAETLGGGLLTVEGEQHTVVSGGGSACVNDAVSAYLTDLRLPPAGARCTL